MRWIEPKEAADQLGISVSLLHKLVRSSKNPPPFVRPSERKLLFDLKALRKWQEHTWQQHTE